VNYSLIFTRFILFISLGVSAGLAATIAKENYSQWVYYDNEAALNEYTNWLCVAWVIITLAFLTFAWTLKAIKDDE
jgi:preprotein translocase subunit SecG